MKSSLRYLRRFFRTNPLNRERLQPFLLLVALATGLMTLATNAQAEGIGDGRNPTPKTLEKVFPVPSGPKFISFDGTLLDSVGVLPTRDSFSFKVFDGSGNLLLTVVFKPTKQSNKPEEEEASWDVFFAVGGGELQDSKTTIPESLLTTFTTILTPKGLTFRFGPSGEGFLFSTQPLTPKNFDLTSTTLKVVFFWIYPDDQKPGANSFVFENFRTNPEPDGLPIRGPREPKVLYPDKPPVSPP